MEKRNLFRQLPSIHDLLSHAQLKSSTHLFAAQIAQKTIQTLRDGIKKGEIEEINHQILDETLLTTKRELQRMKLRKVYNATGVIIHTNLGRAPLPKEVFSVMEETLCGYTNLEIELDTGERGGRLRGITEKLCPLIGAEDAIVVNNNAAAILLAISACASGKDVIVSRGELVEIGGSFRIPDIIETGGAHLVEVGTTNRTRVHDYERHIAPSTGAILRVHSSNFSLVGFTQKAKRTELAQIAEQYNIPFIEDLGSGLIKSPASYVDAQRIEEEESISKALNDGVDLITFSGDKLLGGPQAGFIVGKKELVQKCARHPLYRAMRLGKMSLCAIETILQMYVEGRESELPVWHALEKTALECRQEALVLQKRMGVGEVIALQSYSGGGSLPNQGIESFGYFLSTSKCQEIAQVLRRGDPSILVRIQNSGIVVDTRSILSEQRDDFMVQFCRVVLPLL